MLEIKPGQIYKVTKTKFPNFPLGDHFIILSTGENCSPEFWLAGCFWSFGHEEFGGARQAELTPKEIAEISEYVGYLPDLIKSGRNFSGPGADGMITVPLIEYDKIREEAWKYRELCK